MTYFWGEWPGHWVTPRGEAEPAWELPQGWRYFGPKLMVISDSRLPPDWGSLSIGWDVAPFPPFVARCPGRPRGVWEGQGCFLLPTVASACRPGVLCPARTPGITLLWDLGLLSPVSPGFSFPPAFPTVSWSTLHLTAGLHHPCYLSLVPTEALCGTPLCLGYVGFE